jgi:EAL domain-containing protein (putative c-di-GMP-specific phosphodiesterase class I)
MDPASVEFEITESVIMRDADLALQLLREFKAIGVRITVDDFGTGYSSLSYLKRFPVDALKIDRSFVREVALSARDAAITEAVIRLSGSLQMDVIAEGVETSEQRDVLGRQGCRLMQGYFFGHPMSAGDLGLVLRKDGGRISAIAAGDLRAHRKLIISGSSPTK